MDNEVYYFRGYVSEGVKPSRSSFVSSRSKVKGTVFLMIEQAIPCRKLRTLLALDILKGFFLIVSHLA